MKGKNQRSLKEENTSVVLKLVRDHPGISRADIVRITKLTPPTISRLISFLIDNNLMDEKKSESDKIGRKPIGLYFNKDAFYIVGIDFSYLHIKGAMFNLVGEIIEEVSISVDSASFSKKDMGKISKMISSFISRFGKDKILGIGLSSPGMIDDKQGIIIRIPHFPKVKNLPVREILVKEFGLCTIIVNDANAEAVGEKYFGEGKNISDFVLLHLGYGIGLGIILENKLYTGNFGVSGEIGHTSIDRRTGNLCDCGNKGCVELYVGLEGIFSDISKFCGKKVSLQQLKKLVSSRDKKVLAVLEEKAELIGYVLVNVVNLLVPQKIIVSGPVASLGKAVIDPIKNVVEERSFYGVGKRIPIVNSRLKGNNCLLGATTMILERFLEKPYEFLL